MNTQPQPPRSLKVEDQYNADCHSEPGRVNKMTLYKFPSLSASSPDKMTLMVFIYLLFTMLFNVVSVEDPKTRGFEVK